MRLQHIFSIILLMTKSAHSEDDAPEDIPVDTLDEFHPLNPSAKEAESKNPWKSDYSCNNCIAVRLASGNFGRFDEYGCRQALDLLHEWWRCPFLGMLKHKLIWNIDNIDLAKNPLYLKFNPRGYVVGSNIYDGSFDVIPCTFNHDGTLLKRYSQLVRWQWYDKAERRFRNLDELSNFLANWPDPPITRGTNLIIRAHGDTPDVIHTCYRCISTEDDLPLVDIYYERASVMFKAACSFNGDSDYMKKHFPNGYLVVNDDETMELILDCPYEIPTNFLIPGEWLWLSTDVKFLSSEAFLKLPTVEVTSWSDLFPGRVYANMNLKSWDARYVKTGNRFVMAEVTVLINFYFWQSIEQHVRLFKFQVEFEIPELHS